MSDNHWAFIVWAPHGRRSESLAKELGAKLHLIHYLRFQYPPIAPIKYALQAIRTLKILYADRPEVVFVQIPPFVCGFVVYLFCRLSGAQFVLDHHSAAFGHIWDWALPLQKLLAQRAVTNIVTNEYWVNIIHSWDASALIMGDPFLELPQGEAFPMAPSFNVVFISTFASDEPIDAVLEAATQLPEIRFYITGDTTHQPKDFLNTLPTNVTCTGFLPDPQYIGLLRVADAIMVLTTRNHTLQLGGCEAVSLGKPLITSDWPFLQQFFARGTIYATNSADSIRDGILAMQKRHKELAKEMISFRQENRQNWKNQLTQLNQMIAESRMASNLSRKP